MVKNPLSPNAYIANPVTLSAAKSLDGDRSSSR